MTTIPWHNIDLTPSTLRSILRQLNVKPKDI